MRHLAALILVAVLAAGCGSDSSTDTTSNDDTPDTTEAAMEETTTAAPTTTEATTTTVEETTTVAEVEVSDGDVDAFCSASAENERLTQEALNAGAMFDPAGFEAFFTDQLDRMADVEPPAEIAADFATLRENLTALRAAYAAVDFDVNASTPDIEAISASAEAEAATDRIDAWETANCPGATTDPTTGENIVAMLESEAGREFFASTLAESIDGLSEADALCLIENTSPEVVIGLADFAEAGVGAPPDPALLTGLLVGMDACGLSIEQFLG